jgi:GTPase Era involved in 16S rRNA processing
MRTDSKNQKGLKVRKGLGTGVDEEADEYVRQMNEILSDESWWNGDRRSDAQHRFAPVVVSAFFDGIEAGNINSYQKRESVIQLPSRSDGYSRALLLGTTGAGKTTLLRHIIGTDNEDRFPSTSSAKTTTADIEIVTAPGAFDAVVTFIPEHEARAYVDECVEAACVEAVQGRPDAKIMSSFLQHEEQRFRLSYILGPWRQSIEVDEDEFKFDDQIEHTLAIDDDETVDESAQEANLRKLSEYLAAIKALSLSVGDVVAQSVGSFREQSTVDDKADWLEIFGDEVFKHAQFSELVLDVLDEVRQRFDFITLGEIELGVADWPVSWTFSTSDRSTFLAQVRWFSSNHHQQFGRLLTPLVDGMRVRGPFYPSESISSESPEKLVLIDGEGIGHTANGASSISTRVTQRFESADMILLVDNAQQPMQAAPLALLRTVGSSGFSKKLAVAFTHFDQVKGPNLISFDQKKEHVSASIRNAIASLRDQIGIGVSGALDRQIERQSIFLGGLDRDSEKIPVGFRKEISKLISLMSEAGKSALTADCVPIYEFKGLEIAMRDAIDAFRAPWRARLGIDLHDRIAKEHWTRIKALSRRLANNWDDEYGNLMPIADLRSSLQEEASKWLDRPADWVKAPLDDEEREAALDPIRRVVSSRLQDLVSRRLRYDQLPNWRKAFDESGGGSAARRAGLINAINQDAAPHMSASMTQDAREFLDRLYIILKDAIEESGGKIRLV